MPLLFCHHHQAHNHDCDQCRHAQLMNAIAAVGVRLHVIEDTLNRIERSQKEILMKADEALDAINNETNVIADEQVKLGDRVAALIGELGTLTPEQEAKFAAIQSHQSTLVAALHDMAADPANPVPTPVTPSEPTP